MILSRGKEPEKTDFKLAPAVRLATGRQLRTIVQVVAFLRDLKHPRSEAVETDVGKTDAATAPRIALAPALKAGAIDPERDVVLFELENAANDSARTLALKRFRRWLAQSSLGAAPPKVRAGKRIGSFGGHAN